ncbi:MAG: hypothetical protein ABI867_10350 [Kofleriaceae bacterium]
MRTTLLSLCLLGCGGGEPSSPAIQSFDFGPYDIAPGEEFTDTCVQITLHNADYIYINAVELTTGPGFHHSNWFFVPERTFAGEDGSYSCRDRDFNEPVAAVLGGVLFAQSTQAPHEIQQFPEGVVIKIPPFSKIVTQIHLLNASETPLTVRPNIKITPVAESTVTTTLAGISFQNQALALPANRQSRFTIDCDLAPQHRSLFGRDPDFKIYYALAHYHELGTGLTVEAVRPDGSATTVFTTSTRVGDTLGGPIDPAFDMTGYTRVRFSCEFFNPRPDVVRWGVGDQEMCVFLAFSDSTYNWGGGVNDIEEPQNPVDVGTEMQFTNPCMVLASDASR